MKPSVRPERHPRARRLSWSAASCLMLLSLLSPVAQAQWPHWRGPDRNDVVPYASGFEDGRWPLQPIWLEDAGEGGSSPLVVERRVFTVGWRNGKDVVCCRELKSGKELWRQTYDAPRYARHSVGDKSIYSGVSGTPEYDVDGGVLYTLNTDGELRAWRAADGRPLWGRNLYDTDHASRRPNVGKRNTQRDYGYTSSPLVVGDWLVVEAGGDRGLIVALDKRSGEFVWGSELREPAGHTAGPVLMEVDGRPALAVLTLSHLAVISLDEAQPGRTLGVVDWVTDYGNNIASPAVSGSSIIVTSAYNQSAMARFDVSASGLKPVWRADGIASGVCTPVIHGQSIYWAWRGVHCVDFQNGRERWVGGNVGSPGSCIMTADDRLIVLANRGRLSLVETAQRSPTRFQELAAIKTKLTDDAWPHVVLAEDHLLCRDRQGRLQCFRIRQ